MSIFTKKEVAWIIISIIIFEFIIFFPLPEKFNILTILVPPLVILANLIPKKIAAPYYSLEIEHSVWEFQRFGYYRRSYLKKPFPIGLVLPFILSFLSLGFVRMFTFLQFKYKNIPETRILKSRGIKRKEEINDSDIAFTAAWGFYALILLSIIGFILGFPELAKYPIYYGLWNLIPFGSLDGSKLFFGSILTWAITLILYALFLGVILVFL